MHDDHALPQPVRADQAEVLRGDPHSVITLLADPEHTGQALTSNRSLLRRGSQGAPPHLHRRSSELLYVLGGALDVLVDQDISTLRPGDLLVVPPGVGHAFAPSRDTSADVLVVFTPGTARFEYYRLLDRLHRGLAAARDVADSQDRFDNHYVQSPLWTSWREQLT
jgi:uncharacterized cupin superfamily protein